jgi:hypothetical protein
LINPDVVRVVFVIVGRLAVPFGTLNAVAPVPFALRIDAVPFNVMAPFVVPPTANVFETALYVKCWFESVLRANVPVVELVLVINGTLPLPPVPPAIAIATPLVAEPTVNVLEPLLIVGVTIPPEVMLPYTNCPLLAVCPFGIAVGFVVSTLKLPT